MAVETPFTSNPLRMPEGVLNPPAAYGNLGLQPPRIQNVTVLTDQENGPASSVCGSRKRNRDDARLAKTQQQRQILLQLQLQSKSCFPIPVATAAAAGIPAAGLERPRDGNSLIESAATSTSGRSSPFVPPSTLSQDLISCFNRQCSEIDFLIRFQNEKLRTRLEDVRKRHLRMMLWSIEQRVLHRLRVKEVELESARRRNASLVEMVKQITAESLLWSQMAKNAEAIASSLRTSLERAMAVEEGYGDSSDVPEATADKSGTLPEMEINFRGSCRACQQKEVSVLLLPCRHLCLCNDCESGVLLCPICKAEKSAALRISMY